MGRLFEEPTIVDCYDPIEGVFAGSGVTDTPPVTPPPTKKDYWLWTISVNGNDGGSHSDIQIDGQHYGAAGHGWSCTVTLGDASKTIKNVTQVGRGGVSCSYNKNTIWLTSNDAYNGGEHLGFTISVVFDNVDGTPAGSLYPGGYTPSQAEQQADKKLDITDSSL